MIRNWKFFQAKIEVSGAKSKFQSDFDRWIEQFFNPKHHVPKFNKPVEWSKITDSFKDRFPLENYPNDELQNKVELWAADQGYKIDTSSKDEITIQQ